MDNLSKANTNFALSLFKELSENANTQNLFFSPLSISSALAMVFLGAKGNTAAQMAKVLSLVKPEEIHDGYQSLISEINKPGTKYALRIANRLYGDKTCQILTTFIDSCQEFYYAGLEQVDFCGATEDSRKHINAWVEEKTEGKIQNLLAQGVVDSMTRLILVNAMYFKGNWATPFDKYGTVEMQFKINKDESKPVQMMFKRDEFKMGYIGDFQTKILELPYVDNETSMIILLPDEIQDNSTGLEQLERELTDEKLAKWINPDMMDLTTVEVSLPRFKLEQTYNLKPVLRSMGMTDIFDETKVDLSGMSAKNDLVLSEAVHKSFVEEYLQSIKSITAQIHELLISWELQKKSEERSIPVLNTRPKHTSKPVQMMFQREKFNWNYLETVCTHIIELPYVNNDLSMLIPLPDDIRDDTTGLEMLERGLTYETLSKWTSSEAMEKTEVEVNLPRIKMEESYDLNSTLRSMGMRDAFSEGRADFGGMSGKNDLVLSNVFHKCFVEINEEGTEAAAATAATVTS